MGGLSHTVDKIADYYAAIGLTGSLDTPPSSNLQTKTKNALHDSGFVSPANVSLPLAKLIPILSAQIRVPSEEEDTWLLHLQDNPAIKLLGANVYEASVSLHQISLRLLVGESIFIMRI